MSSGPPLFKGASGTTLQSRRPPESDATERPPRDRLPSACMTRCARGSSPEGSGGRSPWLGIDVKDYFLTAIAEGRHGLWVFHPWWRERIKSRVRRWRLLRPAAVAAVEAPGSPPSQQKNEASEQECDDRNAPGEPSSIGHAVSPRSS